MRQDVLNMQYRRADNTPVLPFHAFFVELWSIEDTTIHRIPGYLYEMVAQITVRTYKVNQVFRFVEGL